MMPSTPTRSTALATFAAPALVNSAIPQITGTRPPEASLATSVTAIFSSMVSEVFSPTLPHTTSPDTPSRTRLEMTVWVSSRFTEKSALNWVVTAGNTPLQLTCLLMVSPLFVFRIRIQSDRCGPSHRATAAFAVVGDPVRAGSVSARPLPAVGRGGQQWPPGQVSDSR